MSFKNKILRLFQDEPATVGIDIGNHSIKIAKIVHNSSGPMLAGAGIHVLKPDTLMAGEIKNREEILQSLTSLVRRVDPTGKIKDVVLSLSWSFGVIADRISLKSNKQQSDEELILMEAGQRSPFDVDDITLDYKILQKDPENDEMEVLLVAAKLQVMQSYIDLLYEAGLRPVVIDVDTFAVANAYLFSAPASDEGKVVALVNMGEHISNLTFIKNGIYHSTRDIACACEDFVKAIMKALKVEKEAASEILLGKGWEKYDAAVIRRSLESAAQEFSMGMDLAFNYFQSSEQNIRVEKIVLCGGGACIRDLAGILSKRHNIDVEIADPLRNIAYDEKKFSAPIPENISTILTVAAGLALRRL